MAGPYAENTIVIEYETGSPERYLRFEPDRPPGEQWLHRESEFDRSIDRESVLDRYALPDNDTYLVSEITVPPGERMQIGDVAGSGDRTGGGDLVELLDRDSVPDSWVDETMSLETYLD